MGTLKPIEEMKMTAEEVQRQIARRCQIVHLHLPQNQMSLRMERINKSSLVKYVESKSASSSVFKLKLTKGLSRNVNVLHCYSLAHC